MPLGAGRKAHAGKARDQGRAVLEQVRGEEELSDDRAGGGTEDDVGVMVGDDAGQIGAGHDRDAAVGPGGAGDGVVICSSVGRIGLSMR